MKNLRYFLYALSLVDAGWILFGEDAFYTGDTFDIAMIAAAIPLFWGLKYDIFFIAFMYIPLLFSHAMTAFVIIFVHLVTLLWKRHRKYAVALLLTPILPLAMNYKHIAQGHATRLRQWATYLEYWWDNAPHWIGMGWGSFKQLGPLMPVNGQRFIWFHNDWFQILFEGGYIALALALAIFAKLIYDSKKQPMLLAGVLGFAAFMTFYSPLQVLPGQLIFVSLVYDIYPFHLTIRRT